jgi:hypothetical protein
LTDKATWDAAQAIAAERGNTRDAEMPTTQPGYRYPLRSRVRCNACQHRMHGISRPSPAKNNPGGINIYYRCPYNPANPRHAAAHPAHPNSSISVRQDTLISAIGSFLDDYVFGHDRAAHLAALIPATDTDAASRRDARAAELRAELARIETAQSGLLTELEDLGPDTSPAATAYRQRIRTRNAQLHDQRTRAETQLTDLKNATSQDNDPHLLDELPYLPGILHDAPDHLIEQLLAALNTECLFRKEQNQATIWVTITDSTPATIAALLTDPRTDDHQPSPAPPADSPEQAQWGELAQSPICAPATTIMKWHSARPRRIGNGENAEEEPVWH